MSDEQDPPEKKKDVQEAQTVIWSDGHASAIKASLARLMQEKAEKEARQKADQG